MNFYISVSVSSKEIQLPSVVLNNFHKYDVALVAYSLTATKWDIQQSFPVLFHGIENCSLFDSKWVPVLDFICPTKTKGRLLERITNPHYHPLMYPENAIVELYQKPDNGYLIIHLKHKLQNSSGDSCWENVTCDSHF